MALKYDPAIIYDFAERLYRRAAWVALQWGVLGGALGFLCSLGVPLASGVLGMGRADPPILIGILVGGFIGGSRGIDKGFALRLEAQRALCHVAIEENTRGLRSPETRVGPTGTLTTE